MTEHTSRQPLLGHANLSSSVDALLGETDPFLLLRKGSLYLLCTPDADPALISMVHTAYYGDSSFDTLPSLRAALLTAYRADPDAPQNMPAALVMLGLEASVVSTREAAGWLVRFGGAKEAFLPGRRVRASKVPTASGQQPAAADLATVQWRLSAGDTLALVALRVDEDPSIRRVAYALHGNKSVQAMARSIARAARRGGRQPAIVAHMPGFSPVPEMGPVRKWPSPRPQKAGVLRERGPSPIVPALLIAVVAVAAAIWLRRPELSTESLSKVVTWMLTPVPTVTRAVVSPPAAPTLPPSPATTAERVEGTRPAAAQSDPRTPGVTRELDAGSAPTSTLAPATWIAPELLGPTEDESVHGRELLMSWTWDGVLGEDEYFDVRLWRLGAPPAGIAWTKDPEYVERVVRTGWHSWTVAVIRGKDGVIEEELVKAPEAVNFRWVPDGVGGDAPNPTATPVPPTRVTPITRPTRVTPMGPVDAGSR